MRRRARFGQETACRAEAPQVRRREGGLNQRTGEENKGLKMTGFYYVYMLSDVATRTHHYVGMTENLESRLEKHNSGQVSHTSKFAPWTVDAAIAVRSKTIAARLERYFKSGSGRAFANKHLFPPAIAQQS